MQNEVFSTNSSLPRAIFFVVLFAVCVRLCFVQTQTLDDVSMTMLPSGCGWVRLPDNHLMFSHMLIGGLLEALYKFRTTIPWYGSYIFFINLVGIGAGTFALLERGYHRAGIPIACIFLASICLPAVCLLNFTTSACMLGLGGFSLVLGWCEKRNPQSRQPKLVEPLVGCGLLTLSSLVRYEAGELIQILSISTLLIQHLLNLRTSVAPRVYASCSFIGLAAILSFCFHAWNNLEYASSPGWSEFYESQSVERDFADCGLGEHATEEQKIKAQTATTWTSNDIAMLRNFFMFDTLRYPIQSLRAADSILRNTHYVNARGVWRDFKPIFSNPVVVPICFSWIISLAVLNCETFSRKKLVLLGVLSIGLMLAVLILLKLPEWIYIPVFSFNLYVALFFVNRAGLEKLFASKYRLMAWMGVTVLSAIISVSTFNNCWLRGNQVLAYNRLLKESLKSLRSSNQNLYVYWADSLPLGFMLPFDDVYSELKPLKMISLTVRANNPLAAIGMKDFDINPQNFGIAMTRKNVLFIGYPKLNNLLGRYLSEHYGIKAGFELTQSYAPLRLNVYKISVSN